MARRKTGRTKELTGLGATPERVARGGIVDTVMIEDGWRKPVRVHRNLMAWPVDRLRNRKMLTERQHEAATWYREQYERAGLTQRVVASMNVPVDGGRRGTEPTEAQWAARRKWLAAREVLPRPIRAPFEAMVIDADDASSVGANEGYMGARAATAALVLLRAGCDIVADYLRISKNVSQ
ncbi:hypothetical protein AQ1_01149 [alpha proteobacterium Q-1]|nr:hypothetical protein AQ1_01149 [alpha proteobacterium Q-1]